MTGPTDTPTPQELCLVDGVPVAQLDIHSRAFHYGDGIFETMRCRLGRIPLLALHRERLVGSAARVGLQLDLPAIDSGLQALCDSLKHHEFASIKLIASRRDSARASYPGTTAPATITLFGKAPFSAPLSAPGVTLLRAATALPSVPALAGIKHLNRLIYIVGALHHAVGEDEELMFCDAENHVIETMHHNIFFLRGTTLVTPELCQCGVAGVGRRLMIEQIAPQLGLAVEKARMPVDACAEFSACVIVNALRGVRAVDRLETTHFQSQALAQRCQVLFEELVAQ